MTRSVWKGPFVDGYLLKKADAARSSGRNTPVKTWSRRSTILPQFVGLTFQVHNGNKYIPVLVSEDMVGHKLGEFAPTPDFPWPLRRRQEGGAGACEGCARDEQESQKALARRERGARVTRSIRVSPASSISLPPPFAARRSTRRSPSSPSRASGSPARSRKRSNRRLPMPRTTTISTSTRWSWPRPMSARTWS